VGAYLLNESLSKGFHLYYWREGNDEVDFVIDKKKMAGIEVKSGAAQKKSGMPVFQKKFDPQKMLLVGGNALPWQDFLKLDPLELIS
jgi:predicted AAA+ superfamily ATPase